MQEERDPSIDDLIDQVESELDKVESGDPKQIQRRLVQLRRELGQKLDDICFEWDQPHTEDFSAERKLMEQLRLALHKLADKISAQERSQVSQSRPERRGTIRKLRSVHCESLYQLLDDFYDALKQVGYAATYGGTKEIFNALVRLLSIYKSYPQGALDELPGLFEKGETSLKRQVRDLYEGFYVEAQRIAVEQSPEDWVNYALEIAVATGQLTLKNAKKRRDDLLRRRS